MSQRYYEMRHVVGFEETNVVGNVYYTNHIRWQGRCREMFLRDYAPGILEDLKEGLALVTRHVSCEYLSELQPFDQIVVRMRLGELTQSDILLLFEYFRESASGLELIAQGEQKVSCMRRRNGHLAAAPVPQSLRTALEEYR